MNPNGTAPVQKNSVDELNTKDGMTSPQASQAFKKQFMYGHMEEQLLRAGEPESTVEAIQNGTYNLSMPVNGDDVIDERGSISAVK